MELEKHYLLSLLKVSPVNTDPSLEECNHKTHHISCNVVHNNNLAVDKQVPDPKILGALNLSRKI